MYAPPGRTPGPPPIRTRPLPELDIPESYGRLRDIVYNLWWTWSPAAHRLFRRLSPATWRHYRNPIDVLIDLGDERWCVLQDDDDFARDYQALVAGYDAYLSPRTPTWFEREHGDYRGGPFAYFCTEFGWHECLQTYSGGLGVLAGDHTKAASDLGLPFVGVGLMYKHGYFRQTVDAEGFQQHFYPDYDLNRLPLVPVVDARGKELHVGLALPGREIKLRIWRALVGRVPVLLLDSDLPINHPADRTITSVLYVRGREMRLCQEIVLGLGGAKVLEALGIEPEVWHANEGHSALLALHRLPQAEPGVARTAAERLRTAARGMVFTTHTPVPAGNEEFDLGLIRKYFAEWVKERGIEMDALLALGHMASRPEWFNLTALALRASGSSNGVSELHGRTANGIWKGLLEAEELPPIGHVTNGVHPQTWIGPAIGEVLRKHGADFEDDGPGTSFAERVAAIPDYELWTAHLNQKQRLIQLLRQLLLDQLARHGRSPDSLREVDRLLDPDVLTIGFARRFATYKRADLVLHDEQRLRRIVGDATRPVQLIFAGKAHPSDRPGQEIIRRIHQASRIHELGGRLIFVESYDMRIARQLVQGCDLWLNTPRRPLEASGTSGMKAAMNGVLNCSILDGWWCEGYDATHGFTIGNGETPAEEEAQDRTDADALYRVLEEQILPAYYERNEHGLPAAWIRRMKRSIALLTPRFGMARVVREYVEHSYLPAAGASPQEPGGRAAEETSAGGGTGGGGRNRTDE